MRRFVDGREVELKETRSVSVHKSSDRLLVHAPSGTSSALAVRSGETFLISYRGRQYRIERAQSRARSTKGGESGELFAPMPGQIVEVLVREGESVSNGQKILVLEAMKTQQAFTAPFAGTLEKVAIRSGAQVTEGQLLAIIKPEEA